MVHPTHPGMTIDQLQARLMQLETTVSDAIEEQHQICEELMSRAEPDQDQVDWSMVREAVMDTADFDGIGGPKALQAIFKQYGLVVSHLPDAAPSPNTDCKNEGAPVDAGGACLACPAEAGETCQRINP